MVETRKIGIVDLGSNSFHMMISTIEGKRYTILDRFREPVRLRLGLREDGSISEEAQERALECLARFEQRLRGLDHVRVVGTNTLRRARDPSAFLKKIEAVLKNPVNVIGGMEEARLIYLGVSHSLPPSEDRNFVIDIGGGSTEFIIGEGIEPKKRETRPMGCVSFSMDYFPDNVPTKKRMAKALLKVGQELEAYHQSLSREKWDRCIGASGTIKAISSVLAAMGEGNQITAQGLENLLEQMKWGQPLDRNSLPGLREDRVPVFLGGFAVLKGIFDTFKIESMDVSALSMREGLLLDLIGRVSNEDIRLETVNRLKQFYSVDEEQAERMKRTALHLFPQIMGQYFRRRGELRRMLVWAADLHEIGRGVANSGYHKHGAYILQNGDLDGFSQVEQCRLAYLVLNHRKRLKTDPLPYGTEPEWPLVFILRLTFILHRERIDYTLPDIALTWYKRHIEMHIDPDWLAGHPMTRLDLEAEQHYWRRINYQLVINGKEITA